MVLNSKFQIPTLFELFRSLKNVQAEWKYKTPMQKWCYFYGIGKGAYGVVRMPNMNDINHVHWIAYYSCSYSILTVFLMFYSLFYYARDGNLLMGLPSTCIGSILIGVCKKRMISISKVTHL